MGEFLREVPTLQLRKKMKRPKSRAASFAKYRCASRKSVFLFTITTKHSATRLNFPTFCLSHLLNGRMMPQKSQCQILLLLHLCTQQTCQLVGLAPRVVLGVADQLAASVQIVKQALTPYQVLVILPA
jgi:hypothetical protein